MVSMETRNTMKYLTIGAVLFLAGAIIGAFANSYLSAAKISAAYQSGFDAAKTLVLNSSLAGFINTQSDVHTLTGTVTAINGNQFTLHLQSVSPFDDPTLADRIVTVDSATQVVNLVPKDPKIFKSEVEAYAKLAQSGASTSMTSVQSSIPPNSFTQIATSSTAIKVGDPLTVAASENIKTAKEFVAVQVQIQARATTTSVPVQIP